MARRRLTIRRIDPWSVLKFGAVVSLAVLAIGLLVTGVVFYIVDRLGLIDQVCEIALDVGFTACGLNLGNLFRAVALLGALGVIIQTAVLVFLSFLHNLIADLTGGITISVLDDQPTVRREVAQPHTGPVTDRGAQSGGSVDQAQRSDPSRPPVPPIGSEEHRRAEASRGQRERADVDRTASLRRDSGELFGGR